MKDLAIKLKIIEVVSNTERNKQGLKHLGKGYFEATRFNKFNPISYFLFISIVIISLLLYGILGTFERWENPFKWS
jgi:hypothetical protein